MDQTNYASMKSGVYRAGTVTNYGWCCGGEKSSRDNYATYKISVFKHWYVYRRKHGSGSTTATVTSASSGGSARTLTASSLNG